MPMPRGRPPPSVPPAGWLSACPYLLLFLIVPCYDVRDPLRREETSRGAAPAVHRRAPPGKHRGNRGFLPHRHNDHAVSRPAARVGAPERFPERFTDRTA